MNEPQNLKPDYIVGIGASAGGLEALQEFFSNMRESENLAFIVIQHLSPDFKSLMDQLLKKFTEQAIKPAENDMTVDRNTIYLIPPNHNLTIVDGKLKLVQQQRGANHKINLPIDVFFHSLAVEAGSKAIGIIMSGTGSDGSSGVMDIADHGGLVICQDPDSAKFDGMPKSALSTNVVNQILRPKDMPGFIKQFQVNPILTNPDTKAHKLFYDKSIYGRIFGAIYRKHKTDFNKYKSKTVTRRISRRMQALLLENLDQYAHRVETDEAEVDRLYNDLTIGVTTFFRDEEAFHYLDETIIPDLFHKNRISREIRIWIAACSTGEEAYSLAILLREYTQKHLDDGYDIKIFASDINENYIQYANQGRYTKDQVESVPVHLLKKYFIVKDDCYNITNDVRNMIVFTVQNLLSDPPFTKMDLVCCRNLLIYLKPEGQYKTIGNFHFSLNKNGYLFLGPSEGLGDFTSDFEVQNNTFKVYKKTTDLKVGSNTLRVSNSKAHGVERNLQRVKSNTVKNLDSVYDRLIENMLDDCLIVNSEEQIVHILGNAKQYLIFSDGRLTQNLQDLIHPMLKTIVTSAIYRVESEGKAVEFEHVSFEKDGTPQEITLGITPIFRKGSIDMEYFVIQFKPAATLKQKSEKLVYNLESYNKQLVGDLERQLKITKQDLNTALEEAETTNEELQSTNEELLASNEELQSTNEELHSVNEELYTVNSEYQKKIEELTLLEDDIENLLQSQNIGTIFLDADKNIRKITPAITKAFGIFSHDIGRSVLTFAYKFSYSNLNDFLNEVIATRNAVTLEPKMHHNQWYILKIFPYLVREKVNGLVLSFIDISNLKKL